MLSYTSRMGITRSSPFAVFAAAAACGIWLAAQFAVPIWFVLMVLGLAVAGAITAWRASHSRDAAWACVFIAIVALGAVRYGLAEASATLAQFSGSRVLLDGVVVEEPDVRPTHTNLRVRVNRIADRSSITNTLAGTLLVRAAVSTTWRYGDGIRADGIISIPPRFSAFDYRDYLARKGVAVWMPRPERLWRTSSDNGSPAYALLLTAKDRVRQTVRRMLPMPESALLNGVLIGDDNDIPQSLSDAFRRTGTSHIVAISGFNVSIIITLVVGLLSRLVNPRRAAAIALPAIWVYAIFVGGSASVLRATIMATITLVGILLWRRGFTLNTLCAAAVFMFIADPNALFDLGFQLSFLATLGLVLYADRISSPAERWVQARVQQPRAQRMLLFGLDGVLMTLAAQLTTLPLIIVISGQLSLVSLVTNALVLPLQPPLMVLGIVAAIIGVFVPSIATVTALPAYAFLTLTIRAVQWTAAWPYASVPVGWFGATAAAVCYVVLAIITVVLSLPAAFRTHALGQLRRRAGSMGIACASVSAVAAGFVFWMQQPDGKLHITFRGSSALVQTPNGQQVVFLNGGHITPMLEAGLPVWDRHIEWLILPRADAYAFEDAQVIEGRYRVGTLAVPRAAQIPSGQTGQTGQYDMTVLRIVSSSVPIETSVVLHMGLAASVVQLRLTHGATSALFMADCSRSVTSAELADVIFAHPRSCTLEQVMAYSPRWVVWADDPGVKAPKSGTAGRTRMLSMAEIDQISFVGDGVRVTLR